MSDASRSTPSPRLTQAKKAERAAREARLAEALRDNLRRRKRQMRARAAEGNSADEAWDASATPSERPTGNTGAAE